MKRASHDITAVMLDPSDPRYPPRLRKRSAGLHAAPLAVLGNPGLLLRQSIGLVCSRRCPGSVILQMYEIVQKLKLYPCIVVGGFHSPMEKECFEILLPGRSGIVLCPAHALNRVRLRADIKQAVMAGRLALVSPFNKSKRRCSRSLATHRNHFVADLSTVVIIPHAASGSSTEALARQLIGQKKTVLTIDDPSNCNLFGIGAQPVEWSTLQPGFRYSHHDKPGTGPAVLLT